MATFPTTSRANCSPLFPRERSPLVDYLPDSGFTYTVSLLLFVLKLAGGRRVVTRAPTIYNSFARSTDILIFVVESLLNKRNRVSVSIIDY